MTPMEFFLITLCVFGMLIAYMFVSEYWDIIKREGGGMVLTDLRKLTWDVKNKLRVAGFGDSILKVSTSTGMDHDTMQLNTYTDVELMGATTYERAREMRGRLVQEFPGAVDVVIVPLSMCYIVRLILKRS